jgi:hypothetical protein
MGVASPLWMRAIDTYGAATAGKVVEVGHGLYKNTANGELSVNLEELHRWCLDSPGHCRFRVGASLAPAKEAR